MIQTTNLQNVHYQPVTIHSSIDSSLVKKIVFAALAIFSIVYLISRYFRPATGAPRVPDAPPPYDPATDRSPLIGLREEFPGSPPASRVVNGYRHRNTPPGLSGTQIRIDLENGTEGVNLKGTDRADREFVEARIRQIRTEVGPHAHTEESWKAYREKIISIALFGRRVPVEMIPGEERIGWATIRQIEESHRIHKEKMIAKFGRQLTIAVAGTGPIGLSAMHAFYQLGYKVTAYEERAPDKASLRQHPFSLMAPTFWYLNSLGVSNDEIFRSFNCPITEEEIEKHGTKPGAEFQRLHSSILRQAREKVIGPQAKDYIPDTMSLPIGEIQKHLRNVIEQLQCEDLQIIHGATISGSERNRAGRQTMTVQIREETITVSPDVIYNGTGGRANKLFGFEGDTVATYYGMGAFFPRPRARKEEPSPPKELSRAVRVFCSHNPQEPIYCNVELNQDEFKEFEGFDRYGEEPEDGAQEDIPPIIQKVMRDVGLEAPKKAFKVQIDLNQVIRAALLSEEEIPQLVIAGGDSLLQPHFITASGANFGFFGLMKLHLLTEDLLNGKISFKNLAKEYNAFARLLQRQSCQTILELFGRDLV